MRPGSLDLIGLLLRSAYQPL